MGHPAVNLGDLSPKEKLELLGEIWDRLSQRPVNVPLSPEQRQELDSRLDALEEDINAGRPLGRPWSDGTLGSVGRAVAAVQYVSCLLYGETDNQSSRLGRVSAAADLRLCGSSLVTSTRIGGSNPTSASSGRR